MSKLDKSIKVDDETHRRLKIVAAESGMTVARLVQSLTNELWERRETTRKNDEKLKEMGLL